MKSIKNISKSIETVEKIAKSFAMLINIVENL